jgi:hypothetical protein
MASISTSLARSPLTNGQRKFEQEQVAPRHGFEPRLTAAPRKPWLWIRRAARFLRIGRFDFKEGYGSQLVLGDERDNFFRARHNSPLRETGTKGLFGRLEVRDSISESPAGIQTIFPGAPCIRVAI